MDLAPVFLADDWGDATFSGFMWENDGKDLRLHLAHASKPITGLVCRWVSDLRVDLTWRSPQPFDGKPPLRRGGSLLTIALTSEPANEHRWSVHLDFGADGHIQFECEDAVALPSDAV